MSQFRCVQIVTGKVQQRWAKEVSVEVIRQDMTLLQLIEDMTLDIRYEIIESQFQVVENCLAYSFILVVVDCSTTLKVFLYFVLYYYLIFLHFDYRIICCS